MERSELHNAVSEGNWEKMEELLESGADPNQCDDGGWSPILTAAALCRVDVIRRLIDAGGNPNQRTKQQRSMFFIACSRCLTPVVQFCIENHFYDFQVDSVGNSPLHRMLVNPKCTLGLLDQMKEIGADFSAPDVDGNTPLQIACYEGREDIKKWILENCPMDSPNNNEGEG